jgi:hypothetical protein
MIINASCLQGGTSTPLRTPARYPCNSVWTDGNKEGARFFVLNTR